MEARGPVTKLLSKLEEAKLELRAWSRRGLNNLAQMLGNIDTKLRSVSLPSMEWTLKQLKKRLDLGQWRDTYFTVRNNLWHQKSRVTWMRDGDANHWFCHALVNGWRRKKKCSALRVLILQDFQHQRWVLHEFYMARKCYRFPAYRHVGRPKVTEEENKALNRDISEDEIEWFSKQKQNGCRSRRLRNEFFRENWYTIKKQGSLNQLFLLSYILHQLPCPSGNLHNMVFPSVDRTTLF